MTENVLRYKPFTKSLGTGSSHGPVIGFNLGPSINELSQKVNCTIIDVKVH